MDILYLIMLHIDGNGERLNSVSLLRKTIPVTAYAFRKRKREGGKKISSKEMGEKGIVFLKSDTKVMLFSFSHGNVDNKFQPSILF